MKWLKRIGAGFAGFFRGYSFISRNGLWLYVILPSLASFVCGLLIFGAVYWQASDLLVGLVQRFAESWGWLLLFLARAAAAVLAAVVYVILYRTVASVIVLPFLGPLLLKTEKILIGREVEVTWKRDLINAVKGMWISIVYGIFSLFVIVVTLPLGPLQALIVFPLQGYFSGRSIFDFILEKEAATLKERSRLAADYRPEILGMGSAYLMVMLIPVFGPLFGPAAALTASAEIYYRKKTG